MATRKSSKPTPSEQERAATNPNPEQILSTGTDSAHVPLWKRPLHYIGRTIYNNPLSFVAVIIATTVGYRNYTKSAEMVLDYRNPVPILNPQVSGAKGFQVTYDGQEVKLPYKIFATIKNPGAIAVEKRQILEMPRITFSSSVKVLEANITPRQNGIKAIAKGNAVEIEILDMLNKYESANIEISIDGILSYYPKLKSASPKVNPRTTSSACEQTIFPTFFDLDEIIIFIVVIMASLAPFFVLWEVYRSWRTMRSKRPTLSRFAAFALLFCIFSSLSLVVLGTWHTFIVSGTQAYANNGKPIPLSDEPDYLVPTGKPSTVISSPILAEPAERKQPTERKTPHKDASPVPSTRP